MSSCASRTGRGVTVTIVAPSELGLSTAELVQIAGAVRLGPTPNR